MSDRAIGAIDAVVDAGAELVGRLAKRFHRLSAPRVVTTRTGALAVTFISGRRFAIFERDPDDGEITVTLTDRASDGEASAWVVLPHAIEESLDRVGAFLDHADTIVPLPQAQLTRADIADRLEEILEDPEVDDMHEEIGDLVRELREAKPGIALGAEGMPAGQPAAGLAALAAANRPSAPTGIRIGYDTPEMLAALLHEDPVAEGIALKAIRARDERTQRWLGILVDAHEKFIDDGSGPLPELIANMPPGWADAFRMAGIIATAGQMDELAAETKRRLTTADEAVTYVLDRIQQDADVGHQCGFGTQVFRLLVMAEAARTSEPVTVEERRMKGLAREPRRFFTKGEIQTMRDRRGPKT